MDLTAILQRYQKPFLACYGDRITARHHQALQAVLACRTERYGQMLLFCAPCEVQQARFHSCGHRHCPRCQHHDTQRWLERQQQKLLPVDYFMVTFTLPFELRGLAWHHQKTVYNALFDCAVTTLKDFGLNDKQLQSELGMTAVLHTHSRRLDFHPHVHVVVPGGGLNKQRRQWIKRRGGYLFNTFALANVFRARFLNALRQAGLRIPVNTPSKWVVDCQPVGKGLPALIYLSRYLYRGVISEHHVIDDDGTFVTFRYKESHSGNWKTRRVKGEHFLWLFFQHVLPKGFRRVRDYGFLHGNARRSLRLVQMVLKVLLKRPEHRPRPAFCCPRCAQPMSIIAFIPPAWRSG